MNNTDKNALKNQALTQRIATLVAQYEDQLADLRAEASIMVEALNAKVEELQRHIDNLEGTVEVSEEADASDEG